MGQIKHLISLIYKTLVLLLLILYLFPGSLIGWLLYGDLGQQPEMIKNPIGTSINHLFYFGLLTLVGLLSNSTKKNILFLISLSVILEILHFVIPNRAFEFYDLLANTLGFIIGYLFYKIYQITYGKV